MLSTNHQYSRDNGEDLISSKVLLVKPLLDAV